MIDVNSIPDPVDEMTALYQQCLDKAKSIEGLTEPSDIARAANSMFNAVITQSSLPPGMAARMRFNRNY